MNHEKQNAFASGRLSSNAVYSPRLSGKGHSLPKGHAPPRSDNSAGGTGGQNGYLEDDVATPVKTFISSNITPRSGSRKARAESASPTPNNTPKGIHSGSRPVAPHERRERQREDVQTPSALGMRTSVPRRPSRSGSIVSDGPGSSLSTGRPLLERNSSSTSTASPTSSPMFFHANELQTSAPSRSVSEKPMVKSWVPGCVNPRGENSSNGRTSAMSNNSNFDEPRSKFFYVNEAADIKPPPLRLANGTSAANRPPLQTIYSEHTPTSPNRAPSPLKEEILPRKPSIGKPSPRRHTRLVSNGGTEIKSPEAISYGQTDLGRRSSLNSRAQSRGSAHARSSSVHSAGPSPSRRSSIAFSDTSAVEKTKTTSMVGVSGALPHSVNPPATTQGLPVSPTRSQPPQSPTKPKSRLEHMNELAANARRERKVLDLEISNSSLLAINRTLESEMRKQNAELRRYRRLSRSGRLSVAPSCSVSGRKSMLSETDTNIDSDELLSPSASEDSEGDNIENRISNPSTSSSPTAHSARSARSRFQDPEPPTLDLTAHKPLLLESQKLNQSMKRCLDTTSTLLATGKAALEHRLLPHSTENLGPKVLTPDELEDNQPEQGRGLLSPSLVGESSANPWERSLGTMASLDGGLSTPDFSKWGPPTEAQTPLFPPLAAEANCPAEDAPAELTDHDEEEGNETASLDGVSSHAPSPAPVPVPSEEGEEAMPPPARPPPEPSDSEDVGKALTTPGNRSSMQNLGHYLQAFGIFGGGS